MYLGHGLTRVEITDQWTKVDFSDTLEISTQPLMIASMYTFEGPNPAAVRLRDITTDSFRVKIEEEQTADPETIHVAEGVYYMVFQPGLILDDFDSVIGEAGRLRLNQPEPETWWRVQLPNVLQDPIVFMQILTYNGPQSVHPRVTDAGPATTERNASFFFKLEEWAEDLVHVHETIAYVAIDRGVHRVRGTNLTVETLNVDHQWSEPVTTARRGPVVSQCQTFKGPDAVVTRQRVNDDDGETRFRVQEAEGSDTQHLTELVGYMTKQIIA